MAFECVRHELLETPTRYVFRVPGAEALAVLRRFKGFPT